MVEEKKLIYVVKVGREPGIYYSKEEMLAQVVGFPGGIVGKFIELKKAEAYLKSKLTNAKKDWRKEKKESKGKITRNVNFKLKGNIVCLLDCEADRNRAISIGAVIMNNDTNEVLKTFYSTIKPKNFNGLHSFTEEYTGLTEEEITNSPSFEEVNSYFEAILKENNVTDLLSWGNGDRIFLTKCGKSTPIIRSIKNIQSVIGIETASIIYKKQWSLKDIKYFFNIDSEVTHNALSDAYDLREIFIRWKNKEMNMDRVIGYKNELDTKMSNEKIS